MPNLIMIDSDGNNKAIDFSAWGGIDGFLAATSGAGTGNLGGLRKLVPWLQKGISMTGNAVSQLPYAIRDAAGTEIPPQVAWGAVKNPQRYLKLVANSLCGGAGYLLLKTTSRALVALQYVLPNSMTPNYDQAGRVLGFTRLTSTGKSEPVTLDNCLYFWLPDDTVEIGPAAVNPLINASLPARLIGGMDSSFATYSENGFIPPTIMNMSGMPNKAEVEKAETFWNMFLKGWTKIRAKATNAEKVSFQTVGAGLAEFRDTYTQINRQQIENIAASFGIPMSLFMSNAANYATANADRKTWYETSEFCAIYMCVQDTFNEQLFNRFGWTMTFEPEKLDAFQEEEAGKAQAVATLTGSLAANPEAFMLVCDVLGIELSVEQRSAIAEMAEDSKEPEPEPEPLNPSLTPVNWHDSAEDEMGIAENEIAREMEAWRKFAKKGHTREFECKHIPAALALRIRAALKSGQDIDSIFDTLGNEPATIVLAQAISELAGRHG